jgi:small subunit ribosomal protein S14
MAKISAVAKNDRRIKLVKSAYDKRQKLKAIVMNKSISMEERFEAQVRLASLPRNSAKVRIRNRCNITGRPRGYYGAFGLSRIAIRDGAGFGLIPGIIKSSW